MPRFSSFDVNRGIKLDVLRDLYLNFEIPAKELESIFGVCSKTLRKQLRKLGILRSRSEATTLSWKHGTKIYNYSSILKGKDSPLWKGGRFKDSRGYIRIHNSEYPNGYALEHRLIWFNVHPETPEDFIIHHLNGIRNDNRIENLIAVPRKRHIKDYSNTYIRTLQKRIRILEGRLD